MAFPIPISESFATDGKPKLYPPNQTAVHSGKLGDVIYALPACRKLGIRHLILNCFEPDNEPLRKFPEFLARQLIPLLLAQDYIEQVSLSRCATPLETVTESLSGIDHCFDSYRNVPRHLVTTLNTDFDPQTIRFSHENKPVHLTQVMDGAVGTKSNTDHAWLEAPQKPQASEVILVSVTHRWRSFPQWYWPMLLDGLENIQYIGLPEEQKEAGLQHVSRIECNDHLELLSWISSCSLFLGTVSFPYSLAEGLKCPRFVELCHFNLNVFPTGDNGHVLSQNVIHSREAVLRYLPQKMQEQYKKRTQDLRSSPLLKARTFFLFAHGESQIFRRRLSTVLRSVLSRVKRSVFRLSTAR